jgi:hypothetical protein
VRGPRTRLSIIRSGAAWKPHAPSARSKSVRHHGPQQERTQQPEREQKESSRASQEIAKDPARMHAAEREGFAPQVKNFVRQAERERAQEKGRGVGKDRDFDMER